MPAGVFCCLSVRNSWGGLSTPRKPCEIKGGSAAAVLAGEAKVMDSEGRDVTEAFIRGAKEVLRIAKMVGARGAILKERSPSCGSGCIYDGSFQHRAVEGQGVCSALLRQGGLLVYSEQNITAEVLEAMLGGGHD
ncbi:MAG TPA: DUF523 domain-containing protein [Bacillota bacterium]|nr:DUF523 domain-containing protein [Bacillota bacterium]